MTIAEFELFTQLVVELKRIADVLEWYQKAEAQRG